MAPMMARMFPVNSCFNGAMAVRPWMAVSEMICLPTAVVLQWGHGREAMDGLLPP